MYIIPIPFDGPKIKPSKSYMILKFAFLYEKKDAYMKGKA